MKSELLDKMKEIWAVLKKDSLSFVDVVRLVWPMLTNSVTLVDVAGIWSVVVGDGGGGTMDMLKLGDFISALAKVRNPSDGSKATMKLMDEVLTLLTKAAPPAPGLSSEEFERSTSRSCLQEVLKVDTLLKNAFATFAGDTISMTGTVQWSEVQQMSLGMEVRGGRLRRVPSSFLSFHHASLLRWQVEGFLNFAHAYSITPDLLSEKVRPPRSPCARRRLVVRFYRCPLDTASVPRSFFQQCESLALQLLSDYRVDANDAGAPTATLLYCQFELLVCFVAIAVYENRTLNAFKAKPQRTGAAFAKKVAEVDTQQASTLLADLFKQINLGKSLASLGSLHRHRADPASAGEAATGPGAAQGPEGAGGAKSGGAASSSSSRPKLGKSTRSDDQYTSTMQHGRQAMVFRMQDKFEEVRDTVYQLLSRDWENTQTTDVLRLIDNRRAEPETLRIQNRFASKPVVITDAVPMPLEHVYPEVQQLIKSALSHHNLGSFEEAIMFFEAAKVQFAERAKQEALDAMGEDELQEPVAPATMPLSLELYIVMGKGNVYRSCGEDEQSLLEYVSGWEKAKGAKDRDWEHIFLNAIGSVAYYSIRYDIALLCFHAVSSFRQEEYGLDSADTATALNNEGCCLFGMGQRSEARLRFEKAWATDSKILGHRAPRTVMIWQNLDRARRSAVAADPTNQAAELKERIQMRPDSDRLLVGGKFTIKAIPPPGGTKKKGGKGGGKKGGGKKKKK